MLPPRLDPGQPGAVEGQTPDFVLARGIEPALNQPMQSSERIRRQPPLTRRDFLVRTAVGAVGAALGSGLGPGPGAGAETPAQAGADPGLVGSNIYGWTQYAQREKRKLDVGEVISALRDCGYDYLENFMNVARPEANAEFAEQLRQKGLRPVSLYTGARLHEADQAEAVVDRLLAAAKVCAQAGFTVLSCNPDPIGRAKTDAELATQAKALTRLGQGLKALGLQLGVHNHLPEMADQAREFHYNFRHTDPELVGFCYDVHWVWKGGVPPAEALRLYGNRVVTWHLRQSRNGVWWEELDDGDVDYPFVAAYAKEHKLPRRFTVELALEPGTKVTRSVVENHRRSRQWVRRVFGV